METYLVGNTSEFLEDNRKIIRCNEELEICVFKVDNQYFAYLNECIHQGGPVCEGEILGKVETIFGEHKTVLGEKFSDDITHIVCPWHGWEFNVKTGESAADKSKCLKKFEVLEEGEEVYVIVK
ncbi:Rieske (2Fe-2S) protein [Bacillus sp. Marseille-P3661]|uniref:Rieske (2Fe-2S) protein n=1 Tax=Bacillus sp. Marseille-P3661 TaxID=1936234 RepID=UPI000C8648C8|nr:Rieske (2Fe-2S) protein [Bacillus sp. Marseille-P3661]